jgi:hypothetical protein
MLRHAVLAESADCKFIVNCNISLLLPEKMKPLHPVQFQPSGGPDGIDP